MPSFIHTETDEKNWQKAKKIVRKNYPGIDEESSKFWKLVNHIYFSISGKKNTLAECLANDYSEHSANEERKNRLQPTEGN